MPEPKILVGVDFSPDSQRAIEHAMGVARHLGAALTLAHVVTPPASLAELARTIGAELVVVSTHGRTGLRRVLLGSVAEKTVRLAEASVLVAAASRRRAATAAWWSAPTTRRWR